MGFGEQGNKAIYFSGTREQTSKTEGNRGTKAILGNKNIGNQDFDFGEQGKMPIFQGNKGTDTPTGRASILPCYLLLIIMLTKPG